MTEGAVANQASPSSAGPSCRAALLRGVIGLKIASAAAVNDLSTMH
jgi:hypothetical protein